MSTLLKKLVVGALTVVLTSSLVACKKKVPLCSDVETLSIARKIILQWIGGPGELNETELAEAIKFEYPLASSFNESIKKYTCTAKVKIGLRNSTDISYSSQLDDKDQHIVTVNGISRQAQNAMTNSLYAVKHEIANRPLPASDETITKAAKLKADKISRTITSEKLVRSFQAAGYLNSRPDAWSQGGYTQYLFFQKPYTFKGHDILVVSHDVVGRWIGCCPTEGFQMLFKVDGGTGDLESFARAHSCKLEKVKNTKEYFQFSNLRNNPLQNGNFAVLSCRNIDMN